MAANEISERLAASCWLRLEPSGAVPGPLEDSSLTFRSMVGFRQEIMTNVNPTAEMILLFLDREMSRRETTVHVTLPFTVRNSQRDNYPDIGGAEIEVECQPFHSDWIGNPTAPSWRPFDAGFVVPAGLDLDRYNGVAVRVIDPSNVCDICLTILEHPRWDGQVTILNVMPNIG